MPAYNSTVPPSAIWPGDVVHIWTAEQPVLGTGGASASQQVALGRRAGDAAGVNFQGYFSAAPGTFEIDVQGSDVDVDSQYQTLPSGNITSVDATNQTFGYEDPSCRRQFVRALMRARANAVNVTADFTR